MTRELEGRKALVLAASRGLGRAIAEALAAGGADVAICSRDAAACGAVAQSIAARFGVLTFARGVDVCDADALAAFVRDAAGALGGLGILVTNAGGPPAGGFEEVALDAWEQAFRLNLRSVVVAVSAALPFLRAQAGASICCVVSSSVKTPIPRLVLSNAFRPGIVGVAKTLAGELAPEGIRVNCVAPGRIDTERVRELDAGMAARAGRELAVERRLQEARIPLGRYGTPEEFAAAVRFLASDAARYLTGQTLFVDGGLTPTLV